MLTDELQRIQAMYGPGMAGRKLRLLESLGELRLPSARQVLRFHEALCFLRAYPDSPEVLARVETLLLNFERRADLRRHRRSLRDSGIAGTSLRYSFFQPTASWLAQRWPHSLHVDWSALADPDRLEGALELLVLWAETPALDELAYPLRQWVRLLKGARETDATFLIRRFDALPVPAQVREHLYNGIDLPLRLDPGPGTPSRTLTRWTRAPVAFQRRPLRTRRPRSLWTEAARGPLCLRALSEPRGREIASLAREAMVTRARDFDAFCNADPSDVRILECGQGLQIAAIGVRPGKRLLLEAFYGFLVVKNGIPIGYGGMSGLLRSSEIAFNLLDTWRGVEAAHIYGRVVALLRVLFDIDTVCVYPYQLGHQNEEGLRSGAWWFYQKLGFRAKDPEVLALMEREEARARRRRGHRSDLATLRRLARENVFLHRGKPRDDVIGVFPLEMVGQRVIETVAARFGSARERAESTLEREAASRLEIGDAWKGLPPDERLAFTRWSPLLSILPGIEGWSPGQKRALYAVVRAKGGRRESDYVRRFDRHAALRRALATLAEGSRPI